MTIISENTSIVLGARVWGASALRIEDYDHTGTTMAPITRNQTGNRWYIEQDQATAAADSSEDILALIGQTTSGPAVRYRCLLAARAPDSETISVRWYRDGVADGAVVATVSDPEWRLLDLGVKTFSMADLWNSVPVTLRLYGGLVHAAFLYMIPRAIYYEAEDNPGADATTATVSYAFAGEAVYRAAPWGTGEQVVWGPVTPSSLAPTGQSDFVQPVGLWKADPAFPDGGGLNVNWSGYIGQMPSFYAYIDGAVPYSGSELSASRVETGSSSGAFMEQFAPFAMVDPMGNAATITGTGINVFSRGFIMNDGSDLDFRWNDAAGYETGDDADMYLDAVLLARPAEPATITGGCNDFPVGTDTIEVTWTHPNPGRVVQYGVQVFHQSPTWVSISSVVATSPYTLDVSAFVEGDTYRISVWTEYIDSSFTYDYCDVLVTGPVYGPASLAMTVSM